MRQRAIVCFPQACNPKYSDFDKTGSICTLENINDTLTQYRWLVSAPTGPDGVTSPMREVDTNTFFTNTKSIALDSIYFQAGSRVQCAARAYNVKGEAGLELSSPIATISQEEGECRTGQCLQAFQHSGLQCGESAVLWVMFLPCCSFKVGAHRA